MFIFEIIHLKIPFAYFPIQIIPQCAPLGKPNIKYLQFCRKYPQLSAFAPALRVTLMPCAEYFKKKTSDKGDDDYVGMRAGLSYGNEGMQCRTARGAKAMLL
jgi:hypothetical protein